MLLEYTCKYIFWQLHMEKLTCIGCNEKSFFDRFKATDSQIDSYKPIFLAITNSSFGELSPSFGLFIKNNRFYTVFGTECSVWDFNGQFKPELTTLEVLLKHTKDKIGFKDGEDIFNSKLKDCVLDLEKEYGLALGTKELSIYTEFLLSEPLEGLEPIIPSDMELFKENKIEIEEDIHFYYFAVISDLGDKVNLFIDGNGYLQIHPDQVDLFNQYSPFIKKFISDINGSLELGVNIFQEEKAKSKPKKLN